MFTFAISSPDEFLVYSVDVERGLAISERLYANLEEYRNPPRCRSEGLPIHRFSVIFQIFKY